MKAFLFAVWLFCLFIQCQSKTTKHSVKEHKHSVEEEDVTQCRYNSTANPFQAQTGSKRFLGLIMTAFTAFNNIADFMGRANNVVGWFDNINRFMSSGGKENESKVTVEKLNKIEEELKCLSTEVKAGFEDVLAGSEYTQTLVTFTSQVNFLRIIDNFQRDYIKSIKTYKQQPKSEREESVMIATRNQWFDAIDARVVDLVNALVLFLENMCKPLLNNYDLFESYAYKHGEQGSGDLIGLMNFITRIRELETNGYAVWKSHIMKKYENNEARETSELRSIQSRIDRVKTCEDPAIARAFTRMISYKGMPTYGRIRWASANYDNERRCLTNGGEINHKAQICTGSTNQLWILKDDNTLRPKNEPSKCLYLIEPTNRVFETYGFKLLDCSLKYPHKKFYFEYMTNRVPDQPLMHTFFKIKLKGTDYTHVNWRGQNICATHGQGRGGHFDEWFLYTSSCSCPVPYEHDLFECVDDELWETSHGIYEFEPVDS